MGGFGGETVKTLNRPLLPTVCVVLLCLHSQLQAGTTGSQRAVLEDIARGGNGSAWTPLSPQQLTELGAKAEAYLDNYLTHHVPDGLNADIRWTSFNRTSVMWFPTSGFH